MPWSREVRTVRFAHIRAANAEAQCSWHLAVQHYLYCYDEAQLAQDERAVRFFAAKLALSYSAMGMRAKAEYYALIAG